MLCRVYYPECDTRALLGRSAPFFMPEGVLRRRTRFVVVRCLYFESHLARCGFFELRSLLRRCRAASFAAMQTAACLVAAVGHAVTQTSSIDDRRKGGNGAYADMINGPVQASAIADRKRNTNLRTSFNSVGVATVCFLRAGMCLEVAGGQRRIFERSRHLAQWDTHYTRRRRTMPRYLKNRGATNMGAMRAMSVGSIPPTDGLPSTHDPTIK